MSLFSTKSLGHILSSYKHIPARPEVATLGISFQVLLSLLNSKGVAWVREFVGGVDGMDGVGLWNLGVGQKNDVGGVGWDFGVGGLGP